MGNVKKSLPEMFYVNRDYGNSDYGKRDYGNRDNGQPDALVPTHSPVSTLSP